MKKEEYIKIANILNKLYKENKFSSGLNSWDLTQWLIDEFAYMLENNPDFDEKKFREIVLDNK